ncbi:MAG: carboxy terminal-processing peptidase [Pontiellaceae bacterium]|nr:carboxy terminal-processing peptidase [Pontiellaceae bacterium]
MRIKPLLLTLSLLTLPMLGSCDAADDGLDTQRITRSVAYSLPLLHLNQLPLDQNISTDAFSLFINSLDSSHCYFLQSDIDAFKKEVPGLAAQLRRGDIAFAQKVFDVLKKRIENRMAFIENQLEKGFDTRIEETFLWDREEAPWPKDEAEWDDLWRKRLKNEYVSRLVSQQVYDEEDVEEPSTNTVESVEVDTADLDEEENLSPEEFIREKYKQFKMTMDTFDDEMLLQSYLTSFTQVYDPHSDYMSPSSVEDFDINMSLSLVGIGAMLRAEDGMAEVTQLVPGGPADRDGRLQEGDKIIAVGNEDEEPVSILHWPLYKAVRLIRGEINTKVILVVIPASDRSGTRTKTIDIMRDEVKLEEQAAKGEVKEFKKDENTVRKFGIINLPDFYADFEAASNNESDARRASTDLRRIINEQLEENIDGLILDLRNNGGGSLVESIECAGLFIPSGPIVQIKENSGIQVLPDADPTVEYDGPMIVLVNRLSASASEILAAALQDYKRAIIVGDEKTHGKGTVQTLLSLGDRRGSVKLTTAGFYRINGGSTQLKGVTPDIIIPDYLDVMGLGEESLEHALPWDTIRPAMYRTQKGLAEFLPRLAERSRERLEQNEEFKAMMESRALLKERYDTKTVSLSLETRLAEAQKSKELDEIQEEAMLKASGEDSEEGNDLVLQEAMHILSDLIDLRSVKPAEILTATEGAIQRIE